MKRRIPQNYDFEAFEVLNAIRTVCPISHVEVDQRGIITIERPDPTPEQMAALRSAVVSVLKTQTSEL